MKISDIMKDDGLFGILAEEDDETDTKSKKKEKGKKKEKTSKAYSRTNSQLKELSKGELRQRCQELGVRGSDADFDSKKSMRHAILKAMGLRKHGPDELPESFLNVGQAAATGPVGLTPGYENTPKAEVVKERPPYYYDEDSGDFIFTEARHQSAMTCLDGFMAMGHIRKQADPKDGFAELTERLYAKIMEPKVPALEEKPAEDVVQVTDYKVIDPEVPAELSAEDAAKLTAKVDDMLKGATNTRKKREKSAKE